MKRRRRAVGDDWLRLLGEELSRRPRKRRATTPRLPPEMWNAVAAHLTRPADRVAVMIASKTHPLCCIVTERHGRPIFEDMCALLDGGTPGSCTLYALCGLLVRYLACPLPLPFMVSIHLRDALILSIRHRFGTGPGAIVESSSPRDWYNRYSTCLHVHRKPVGTRWGDLLIYLFYKTADRHVHMVIAETPGMYDGTVSKYVQAVAAALKIPVARAQRGSADWREIELLAALCVPNLVPDDDDHELCKTLALRGP